jgi:hypothetical protein
MFESNMLLVNGTIAMRLDMPALHYPECILVWGTDHADNASVCHTAVFKSYTCESLNT